MKYRVCIHGNLSILLRTISSLSLPGVPHRMAAQLLFRLAPTDDRPQSPPEFFVSVHLYYNDIPTSNPEYLTPFLDFARTCSRYASLASTDDSDHQQTYLFGSTNSITQSQQSHSVQLSPGEVLTIPVKYTDLPLSSKLLFLVYSIVGPQQPLCIAGCMIDLFDSSKYVFSLRHLSIEGGAKVKSLTLPFCLVTQLYAFWQIRNRADTSCLVWMGALITTQRSTV